LQDAITNMSVQKKFLGAADERAKITRAQYSTGLATFNDWIIIEDNLVKAQKAYLNAQAEMLVAEAYWIQAIGGTLEYD
jgi:outer membrane protein TolC